ncbi:hypothetical protein CRM22_004458 [Opisthorchis felineus]|uniref:26S proteasome non-ATPase regulatory subunit 2 n=1 Tax=Opisthorchis felineus TaxID=147828 RepID=A0A4S2LW27_OPIFE|nr:hypothetical protein CRM22_004458 [Opisthorchis felineus]
MGTDAAPKPKPDGTDKKKGDLGKEDELSEEDKQLQEELNMLVERLEEPDVSLHKPALESMCNLIKSSTTSMTSVPKPLKFMMPHYSKLKEIYEKMCDSPTRRLCADVVSVVAMTVSDKPESRFDTLNYRLLGTSSEIGAWGHEYVRHLTSQIVSSWQETDLDASGERIEGVYRQPLDFTPSTTSILPRYSSFYVKEYCLVFRMHLTRYRTLISKILSYGLRANVILWNLLQTRIVELLSQAHPERIRHCMLPEDIYKSHLETVRSTLNPTLDSARANLAASYVNGLVNCGFGKEKLLQENPKEVPWLVKQKDLAKMSTVATLGWVLLWDVDTGLSQIDKYLYSAEDHTRAGGLLGCGVVNCGVKNECDPALALLGSYVESDKDVLSRAAIIGLGVAYAGSMKAEAINSLLPVILDINTARLQHACLAALSAGMIAVGSLNAEVTSTIIQSMLERPTSHWSNPFIKFMALGLGLTCMGRQEEVEVILVSLEAVSEPLKSMAHMMCDFCAYAGSGNVLKVQNLLHILSEKYEEKDKEKDDKAAAAAKSKDKDKKDSRRTGARGRQRRTGAGRNTNNETAAEDDGNTAEADEVEDKSATQLTPMDTSNVEETEQEENQFDFHAHQGLAVLGVALIAMGEEVGLDMAFRMFGHLLRFGELPIKRAVPLALAMCYVSNPQLKVLDTLSKFSHDADSELSYNSVLAMGIVGAGTNNARLAAMLRQLAVYHSRDPYNLFLVRLAQGLTHLGKGTMTLSPWHSERFLSRAVGISGLLTLLVSCLDMRTTFMGRHDYLIFYLTPAIQPRLLMTFDEDLKPLPVTVRVGQAVDVVGQAGRPKTITGFQTYTTPVLLSYGERAELATDEYLSVTQLPLEGFVLLKKNPEYEETTA